MVRLDISIALECEELGMSAKDVEQAVQAIHDVQGYDTYFKNTCKTDKRAFLPDLIEKIL